VVDESVVPPVSCDVVVISADGGDEDNINGLSANVLELSIGAARMTTNIKATGTHRAVSGGPGWDWLAKLVPACHFQLRRVTAFLLSVGEIRIILSLPFVQRRLKFL